jgi:hypothetical protein
MKVDTQSSWGGCCAPKIQKRNLRAERPQSSSFGYGGRSSAVGGLAAARRFLVLLAVLVSVAWTDSIRGKPC